MSDDTTLMSIGAIARATGVPTNTLRTWERRYGFPKPMRDENGERRYSGPEVAKLRALKRLMDTGIRPGKIVHCAIEELDLPEEALEKRALLPLSLFTDPSRLATFLKVFEWVMVNMESSTGELQPLKKSVTPRKGNLSWPGPDVGGELKVQEINDEDFNSYESSFDALLSRKRVELDDEEPADQA